jgi:1,2-dihydroxy-3-keto-5-methylthiopentene dioxygenase
MRGRFMEDKLTIFSEEAEVIQSFNNNKAIRKEFQQQGIRFEQWPVYADQGNSEDILKAYDKEIKCLVSEKAYQSWDVISLQNDHPDKDLLRKKFLSEHTHSEDEVRFFVHGKGLFVLHIEDKVYSVLCEKGDLISVPKNIPHWFDMSESPDFTCIRFFDNPEGWVAHYTESGIDNKFH